MLPLTGTYSYEKGRLGNTMISLGKRRNEVNELELL
jgi:hypothetical protein